MRRLGTGRGAGAARRERRERAGVWRAAGRARLLSAEHRGRPTQVRQRIQQVHVRQRHGRARQDHQLHFLRSDIQSNSKANRMEPHMRPFLKEKAHNFTQDS